MDNLTGSEERRLKLIQKIQELRHGGACIQEIAGITGKSRHTVRKYLEGDPYNLCRSNKHGALEPFNDFIIQALQEGMTQSTITRQLRGMGYSGTGSNVRQYISAVARKYGLKIARYKDACPGDGDGRAMDKKPPIAYITRKGIFNHLWMGIELTQWHHGQLWRMYPVLWEIESCIRQFREIFGKRNMPLLYLFIDRYKHSEIKELASFANGLEKDLRAVENAVASPLSNGFVEGTNNKIKMVKRTMYGRCGQKLLAAKLMYQVT